MAGSNNSSKAPADIVLFDATPYTCIDILRAFDQMYHVEYYLHHANSGHSDRLYVSLKTYGLDYSYDYIFFAKEAPITNPFHHFDLLDRDEPKTVAKL